MATPMTVSQVVSQCKKWKIPYEVYSDAVGRPGSFTPIGFIVHHTGGPYTESDSYLRFLFEVGRPSEGIPGQLCQFSGGPSGKIYIGKMARANHAGRGDFTTRQLVGAEDYPGYSREIDPGSDDYGTGNALYYGLEINYPGTLKMRSAQYNSAVRLAAAIMDFHGWTALSSIGHREHSSRKWDPGQCPLDEFRKDVRDLLLAGPEGDTVSWNEDLTPGTPGNDITNLADKTLPDSYGRDAADLLGYAAAGGSILLRAKELLKRIGKTDGVLRAPSKRPNNDTNPHLFLETFLRETWDMMYDMRTAVPLLQEIKAAQGGTARDEVLAEIQADLATTKSAVEFLGTKLDDVYELAENFADGSLNAEQVAEALMSKFHAATAPDEQKEEI